MEEIDLPGASLPAARTPGQPYEKHPSAVSWGAILAGAVGMAAFSLILLTLGTGLGLSALSPWPGGGVHEKAFGVAATIWICVTQIMSAGLGGYLAGRLRRYWPRISSDETHFRDTAHGFLAWALATLISAALLTSVVSGLARSGASMASQAGLAGANIEGADARGNALTAYRTWPMGYLIDGMLRPATDFTGASPAHAGDEIADAGEKQEIARIFSNSLPARGNLAPEDSDYLASLVAGRTGIAPADARARVATTWSRLVDKTNALDAAARAAADKARKASIEVSLWLFISMLMGAFAASFMATVGGRMRHL